MILIRGEVRSGATSRGFATIVDRPMLFLVRSLLLVALLPCAAIAQEQDDKNVGNSTELVLHARTAEYYLSPPSVGVKIRATFRGPSGPNGDWQDMAILVAETDSEGIARYLLELPTSENGKEPRIGGVFLEVLNSGWVGIDADNLEGPYYPILSKSDDYNFWDDPSDRQKHLEVIVPPGALVKVRAIGTEEQTSKWYRFYADLEVKHLGGPELDRANLQVDSRVFSRRNDWEAGPSGIFSFAEKGLYEIVIRGSDGIGRIASIELDPMDPPQEIAVPIKEFGTISGRIKTPIYWGAEVNVRAIAVDEAIGSIPVISAQQQAAHYPPHYADVLLADDDKQYQQATFKIAGLAPGEYRLGFFMHHTLFFGADSFTDANVVAWFDHPAVVTGSEDVELTIPSSTLQLKITNPDGQLITNLEELGFGVSVILMNQKGDDHAGGGFQWMEHSRDSEYVLFAEHSYRLIAYGPGISLTEYEIVAPRAGQTLEIPIVVDPKTNGKLAWTGPWASMLYEVLSPRFGHRMAKLNTNDISGDLGMERELPPGRYLVRATGLNQTGAEGYFYEEFTPYGSEEIWVDIQAGESTQIEFDPPLVGRIEVDLKATGQSFADPRSRYEGGLVLVEPLTRKSWSLSFEETTYPMEEDYLRPGQQKRCPQGFPAGIYQLQVNIPGFPPQQQEVLIKSGLTTEVQITLKGR
jgi:hypothetical protein